MAVSVWIAPKTYTTTLVILDRNPSLFDGIKGISSIY
jgi:hypothetical protein